MTELNQRATVRVGGLTLETWTRLTVTRAYDQTVPEFEFEAANFTAARAADGMAAPPEAGSLIRLAQKGVVCEVLLDGELALTGEIDKREVQYDKGQHRVGIGGRGRSGAAVFSTKEDRLSYSGPIKAEEIIADIMSACGMSVVPLVDTGDPLSYWACREGEPIWHEAVRVAEHIGCTLVERADGTVAITRLEGRDDAAGEIRGGSRAQWNFLGGNLREDHRESATKIRAKGQGRRSVLGPNCNGPDFIVTTGTPSDREKPLVIRPPGAADTAHCEVAADKRRRRQIGKELQYRARLVGWRDASGALWKPAQRVRIIDDFCGLDVVLAVQRVRFSQDVSSGTTTELELVSPEALKSATKGKPARAPGAKPKPSEFITTTGRPSASNGYGSASNPAGTGI